MNDYTSDHGPSAGPTRPLPRPPLGLVRPKEDGKVAGVCAAVGRATRSDPMLWRVLFSVLVLFAGAGLIVYALLWLFTPGEGDTASPIESLFGRGRSSTAPPITIALAAGVAVAAFVVFWDSFPLAIGLGVALILAIVYLVRSEPQRTQRQVMYGQQTPYAAPMYTAPGFSVPPTQPHAQSTQPGYRAPFAPYGPYAGYTTQSAGRTDAPTKPPKTSQGPPAFLPPLATPPTYGTPPPTQAGPVYPPPRRTPPPPPRAPKPRRPRSKLPWVTLSAMAIVLGVLGMIDLSGASIAFGWYLAAALTICAAGLLVGTWVGRARSMIAVGIVLSLVLMAYTAVSFAVDRYGNVAKRDWQPTSISDIDRSYDFESVDGTLDLRQVPFKDGDDVTIDVNVGLGEFHIILPPNVDAKVTADATGSLKLFGDENGGVANAEYTNLGADGAGGGHITIDAHVDFGELEIKR